MHFTPAEYLGSRLQERDIINRLQVGRSEHLKIFAEYPAIPDSLEPSLGRSTALPGSHQMIHPII
jgi:hypothetical protein